MLTYKNILSLCGEINNIKKQNILKDICKLNESVDTYDITKMHADTINFICSISNKHRHIEHLSKIVLSYITSKVRIDKNNSLNLALISGSKIGPCWTQDCCFLDNNKPCDNSYNIRCLDKKSKLKDIIRYSYWNNICNEIYKYTDEYFNKYYVGNITYDNNYISKCNKQKIKMILEKANYIEHYGFWSYEKLYNLHKI